MPPKHGQSQLISPVSGLNAPCWPASSSSASGEPAGAAPSACAAAAALALSSAAIACALASFARFSAAMASMVGSCSVSCSFSRNMASSQWLAASGQQGLPVLTLGLVRKDIARVVVVHGANGSTPA